MNLAPRYLTAQDVCAYIRCSRTQLDRMVADGRLPDPSRHLGDRMPRWDREAIDAAMTADGNDASGIDAAIARMRDDLAQRRPRRSKAAA